jgi:hypothetical protein
MTQENINFSKNYLAEQIKSRYAMFPRIRDGKSNLIIDSIAPHWIYNKLKQEHLDDNGRATIGDKKPKTAYAISAYFADIFRVPKVPLADLLDILGYKPKEINSLLYKVAKKKHDICLVGYGGSGQNFTYWLTEMAGLLGKQNLFESLTIYEKEHVEYSNILRFPKNVLNHKNGTTHKLHTMTNEGILARATNLIPDYIDQEGVDKLLEDKPNTIFYGGGSIPTMEMLSNYNFVSATHGNNDCTLIVKPVQDSRIQIESYGVIMLSSFFMNQLRMTIGFLEFLAQDDIDWTQRVYLDYNFTTAETRRDKHKYNWQLEHSQTIGLEENDEGDTNVN